MHQQTPVGCGHWKPPKGTERVDISLCQIRSDAEQRLTFPDLPLGAPKRIGVFLFNGLMLFQNI